jgi:oligosaccharyltransferase complex subunit beta
MRWSIFSFALTLLGSVSALSSSGNRLLVVLEEAAQKDLYSKLWTDIKGTMKLSQSITNAREHQLMQFIGRGYELSFESPKNDKLSLFYLGERAYDHVLLLPPSSKAYGPSLAGKELLEFINAEGNILLTLTSEHPTPAAINSLLLELNIHTSPDRHSLVVDHFNYDTSSSPEKHNVLVVQAPKSVRPDVKNFFGGDKPIAVPNAVAQVLGNDTPLLAPILRAPSTAYVHNPKDDSDSVEDVFATGSQISLASAMQARNSARFVVLGSAEALQDKWFDASVQVDGKSSKTGNRQFAKQITSWTFKETGVLKIGRLQHHLKQVNESLLNESLYPAGDLNPKIYRIKNDVVSTTLSCQS